MRKRGSAQHDRKLLQSVGPFMTLPRLSFLSSVDWTPNCTVLAKNKNVVRTKVGMLKGGDERNNCQANAGNTGYVISVVLFSEPARVLGSMSRLPLGQ